MLTRVAASHLRVGTFEFFAARGDREALVTLTTYALARHYPSAAGSGNDALALLECVIDAHANLVARWLGVGFVHGVMNTDNTAISGETLDYGPCAFLDHYDPKKKFSSIDHGGRYAFANQPRIAQWNMARFAETLLGLIADDQDEAVRIATERLNGFSALFEAAHLRVLRAKLGLVRDDSPFDDRALANDLLGRLAENHVDYTLFFRRLCASAADPSADADVAALFDEPGAFRTWAETWRQRLATEAVSPEARAAAMKQANPAFIPRNHRVEQVIEAAVRLRDFGPFELLADVLSRPYDNQPEHAELAAAPGPDRASTRPSVGPEREPELLLRTTLTRLASGTQRVSMVRSGRRRRRAFNPTFHLTGKVRKGVVFGRREEPLDVATRLHRSSGRESQPRQVQQRELGARIAGVRRDDVEQRLARRGRRAGAHQFLGGRVLGLGVSFAVRRFGPAPRPSSGRDDPRRIGVGELAPVRGGWRGAVLPGEVGGQIARDRLGLGRVGEPALAGEDLPETCAGAFDGHNTTRDRDTRRRPARLHREQRAHDGRHRAGRTNTQRLAVLSVVVDQQTPAREIELRAVRGRERG